MIDVFYKSPKGASIGRTFQDETTLVEFVSKLHKPARILVSGVHVGRVWQMDNGRWTWFYDPELIAGSVKEPQAS